MRAYVGATERRYARDDVSMAVVDRLGAELPDHAQAVARRRAEQLLPIGLSAATSAALAGRGRRRSRADSVTVPTAAGSLHDPDDYACEIRCPAQRVIEVGNRLAV